MYSSVEVMGVKTLFESMDIVLDDNKTRYQAGEDVSGLIKYSLKPSVLMANIKISLVCISEVNWTETMGTPFYKDGHAYKEKKTLVKQTVDTHKIDRTKNCKFFTSI